jgi:hypothetical protein
MMCCDDEPCSTLPVDVKAYQWHYVCVLSCLSALLMCGVLPVQFAVGSIKEDYLGLLSGPV